MSFRSNTSSVPCKYYPLGQCRNGNSCRFSHANPSSTSNAAPSNPGFTSESIKIDLTTDRPSYALSSYGPGKTGNLIKDQDLSPEELRLSYYNAVKANNPSLYPEEGLVNKAEQTVKSILADLPAAYRFMAAQQSSGTTPSTIGVFGGVGAAPTTSAFGAFGSAPQTTSVFGAAGGASTTPIPFGGSATSNATSAFGSIGFGDIEPIRWWRNHHECFWCSRWGTIGVRIDYERRL
ncbi:BQ2448_4316 [Microbotryum intermedium]|uniref:BQ2448_4316 protein n=1 Tax=Microbotryum intermedium TaxID=269621 RepID=A0A238FJ01_9BASI|nr:BQ2448_4316 [Microbotryum intermedium]